MCMYICVFILRNAFIYIITKSVEWYLHIGFILSVGLCYGIEKHWSIHERVYGTTGCHIWMTVLCQTIPKHFINISKHSTSAISHNYQVMMSCDWNFYSVISSFSRLCNTFGLLKAKRASEI